MIKLEPITFCEAETVFPVVQCLAFLCYYPFTLSCKLFLQLLIVYSHPYFKECHIICEFSHLTIHFSVLVFLLYYSTWTTAHNLYRITVLTFSIGMADYLSHMFSYLLISYWPFPPRGSLFSHECSISLKALPGEGLLKKNLRSKLISSASLCISLCWLNLPKGPNRFVMQDLFFFYRSLADSPHTCCICSGVSSPSVHLYSLSLLTCNILCAYKPVVTLIA